MSNRKNIFQKILLVMLSLVLCLGLISCKSEDDVSEQASDSEETTDKVIVTTEKEENALDLAMKPINDVELVSDKEVAESIVGDLTEVSELEADSENKGVNLLIQHDGKLKSVALEYPFINWLSEQKKPVLIEFVADYSEPSQKSLPYLNALADKYGDDMLVCKVNIDEVPQFVDTFELEYVPTYYVSKDLTLYLIETGFDPYADPSLIDNIEQVLSQ